MSRMGRAPGSVTIQTLKWAKIAKRMRADGKTLVEIAAALGTSKARVWQICKKFEIGSPRNRTGGPKQYDKRRVPQPIDPEKARQITESKKSWWLQQDRRTA